MSTTNVAPQQLAKAHLHYLQSNSVFPPLGSCFPFSFLRLKPYRSYYIVFYIECPNKTIILILWIRKLPPLEACPFSQDIDLACPVLDLGGFSGDGLGRRYLVLRCSTSTKFTCNTSPTWKSATSKAILFRRKYFQVLPEGCN